MKKIVLCIPTYNGEQYVKEFLNEYAPIYIEHGIDIIYFDSGPTHETQYIVESYCKEKDDKSIYYRRLPSDIHSNKKVYLIFQDKELIEQYEYLWVCSDAIRFSEKAINQLEKAMKSRYDLINLNPWDYENIGEKEYTDMREFFKDCASVMTLYGNAILKCSSMLLQVNWEYYEKKFLNDEFINFSHVGFYFERILELNNIRAIHLGIQPNQFKSSMYKKHSAWYYDCFDIWFRRWPNLVNVLPDYYTDKQRVICHRVVYFFLRNEKVLKYLRYDGILKIKHCMKYRNMWRMVCPIPFYKLLLISLYPRKLLYIKMKREDRVMMRMLQSWIEQQKKIYIYGAGNVGYIVERYLHEKNIPIVGFCVSGKPAHHAAYQGYPIYHYDELKESTNHIYILAMTPTNAEQVLGTMSPEEKTRIYYDEACIENMQFYLGYR